MTNRNDDFIRYPSILNYDLVEPKDESALEKECSKFIQKFTDWRGEMFTQKKIPLKIAINKESNKYLFYIETKTLLKNLSNFKLPSPDKIRELYGDVLFVERSRPLLSRRELSAPTPIKYVYIDRQNGEYIPENKLEHFLRSKGRILEVKKLPTKKIRCVIKEEGNYTHTYLDKEEYAKFTNASFNNSIEMLLKLCTVKVTSCKESIDLFGYKNIKTLMVKANTTFTITNITPNFICKKDKQARNIIEVYNNGKSYKFLLSEIELVIPNIDKLISGYKAAKSKVLEKGSSIKVVNNKHTKLPLKAVCIIKEFKKLGGKEYIAVDYKDKVYVINKKQVKII